MLDIDLKKEDDSESYLSKHVILDFYGCNLKALLEIEEIKKILIDSCIALGATIMRTDFHKFEPHGISGVVILAESHMTIHSWPEHKYAAIDIFICGDMNFKKAIRVLKKGFKPKDIKMVADLKRGILDKIK